MSPRSEPLLWLQLLGLAAIPAELLAVVLILAGADPGPVPAIERLLLWALGALLPAVLLWQRPADCWSLLLLQTPARGRREVQRRLSALQNLAQIDTVIFDKTGTLTRDAFEVACIHTRKGVSEAQALDWAGSLARHSLHPVSRALWSGARRRAEVVGRLHELEALVAHDVSEQAGQGVQVRPPSMKSPVSDPNSTLWPPVMSSSPGPP